VEVASARSANGQTFANPDGTMTQEESAVPRWARRADGSWTAVDTTLDRAADGTVVPAATVEHMSFSGSGTGPLATLTQDGRQLSMSWPAALPAPTLQGDTAVYPDVLAGVDLRVTASAKGLLRGTRREDRGCRGEPGGAAGDVRLVDEGRDGGDLRRWWPGGKRRAGAYPLRRAHAAGMYGPWPLSGDRTAAAEPRFQDHFG
jgi:hypothetical protein